MIFTNESEKIDKWKNKGQTEKLIKAITHPKLEIGLAAINALGEFRFGNASAAVAQELNSPHRAIRLAAIKCLGKMGRKEGIEAILKLLTDNDPKITAYSIQTLCEMRTPLAIIPLLNVRDIGWAKLKAEQALYFVTIEIMNSLEEGLRTASHLGLSPDDFISSVIQDIILIGKIATSVLVENLQNGTGLQRLIAVTTLTFIKDENAIIPLLDALEDHDKDVVEQAASCLYGYGGLVNNTLEAQIKNSHPEIKEHALKLQEKWNYLQESATVKN